MIVSRHFLTRTVARAATGQLVFYQEGNQVKMTQHGYTRVVGIDVSKAKLDIAWGARGPLETIEYTELQMTQLLISKIDNPAETLIVLEATGGYKSPLVDLLHKSGIALAIVNPR